MPRTSAYDPAKRKRAVCDDCQCFGFISARGLCPNCYRKRKLAREWGGEDCAAEGCSRTAVGKRLCELHRNRLVQSGALELDAAPKVGERASSWRGGRSLDGKGYVVITLPPEHPQFTWGRPQSVKSGSISRKILEHRLVMGVAIGRPVQPGETVHHVNGDRADNRLENLQLRQGPHGVGVALVCHACGSHDVGAVPL